MEDSARVFAPELSPAGSRRWIGRLVIAVLLGAAIWNFVVSLTANVVVPGLARVMETDPQSPLYLGKGDINFAAIFVSVLELCFAIIVALVMNSWSERSPMPVRRKNAKIAAVPPLSIAAPQNLPPPPKAPVPTPAPAIGQPAAAAPPSVPEPAAVQMADPPPPATKPDSPAPAAPPRPKKVYYNIVGERIEEDE
jgi:hypothetical protein